MEPEGDDMLPAGPELGLFFVGVEPAKDEGAWDDDMTPGL
jgi:hypothetical protein